MTGARQGAAEAYREKERLNDMSYRDIFGNRVPRPGYTAEQVAAQQALADTAGENFMDETVIPVAAVAGSFLAPAATDLGLLA